MDEMKDKSGWETNGNMYTFVQSTGSLIVQVAVKANGRKLLHEIHGKRLELC